MGAAYTNLFIYISTQCEDTHTHTQCAETSECVDMATKACSWHSCIHSHHIHCSCILAAVNTEDMISNPCITTAIFKKPYGFPDLHLSHAFVNE